MRHLSRTTHRAPRRALSRAAATMSRALASLALAACGGGDGGPDVGSPSHIDLVGSAPTAAVNGLVTPPPSVKVTDAEGRAVPNVSVTFTASGGGSATEGVQRTNTQGVATVGSWRLGTVAGSGNALQAAAGTISTTITATAMAAVAAVHEAAPGQPASQIVQPSTAVAIRPAVRVTDGYGNPKAGMAVTFAASANSGTVTGAAQTTNSEGIATIGGWTVGSATGQQTVVANVTGAGLPAVTFVANVRAGDPTACVATPYTLLSTVAGTLAGTDCPFLFGTLVDIYQTTSASAINHDFRLASPDFDAFLLAYTTSQKTLGLADDESDMTTNSRLRLIAPAGSYLILANSFEAGETGGYTLSSTAGPRAAGCDEDSWVVPGVSFGESLTTTDCAEANGPGTYGDLYFVVLTAGRSATVTMRSTAVNSFLGVLRWAGSDYVLQGTDDNSGGGNDARLTFTAPSSAEETLYAIIMTTPTAATPTGAYTMELTSPTALMAGGPVRTKAASPVLVGPRAIKGAAARWPSAPWGAPLSRGMKLVR
jgi:hypothetical protein